MKICLVNNLYEPYSRGGAETVIKITAEEMQKLGHEVFLITTRPYFKNKKKTSGLKIYYLRSMYHYEHLIPRPLRIFYHLANIVFLGNSKKLKNIIEKEAPGIVIGHNLLGLGFLFPRMIDGLNIKYLQVLHDIQLLHPGGLMIYGKEKILRSCHAKIYQTLTRRVMKNVQYVVSPSQWLINLYRKKDFFVRSNNRTLLNPITIDQLAGSQTVNNQIFTFLSVGRVSYDKGSYKLIKAFKKVAENNPAREIKLVLIGAIEDRKKANKLIKDSSNIVLLGWINNNEVRSAIAGADCLVVPSLCYENSPTVIYEAYSLGTKVIASRIGGITELVMVLGGNLFSPGDKGGLARKMEAEIKKSPSACGAKGRKGVKGGKLYPENYVKELLGLNKI